MKNFHLLFHSKKIKYFFFFCVVLMILKSFFIGYRFSDCSCDLRNRIVGSRLLSTTFSPYYYKWQKDHPITLLDPSDIVKTEIKKVNNNTVPPSILLLYYPFSKIKNFNVIRLIWLFCEYFCVLYMIFYFYRISKTEFQKKMILLSSMLFLFIPSWFVHIKNGQLYILYPFLLTLIHQLYSTTWRKKDYITGFVISIAFWLRFPFILLFIPFVLNRKTKVISGGLIGLLFVITLSLSLTEISHWKDYFSAMHEWSKWNMFFMDVMNKKFVINEASISHDLPKILEGNSIINSYQLFFTDFSIQHLVKFFLGISLSSKILLSCFFINMCVFFAFLRKRIFQLTTSQIFLMVFFLMILLEEFLPARRLNYYFVEWIFAILLIISQIRKNRNSIASLCLIFLGLILYFNFLDRTILLLLAECCFATSIIVQLRSKAVYITQNNLNYQSF